MMRLQKVFNFTILSVLLIPFQQLVYAEAPALWFAIFDSHSYTNSLSGCLNYGEALLLNLKVSNIQKQTYAVVGNRGNSTIVIGCDGNVATLMVSNTDLTESRCVYDTFHSLMNASNTGSGSAINCSFNTSTTTNITTIATNLNIHIPQANYQSLDGTMNLWADLKFVPSNDGRLLWELTNYGVNQ